MSTDVSRPPHGVSGSQVADFLARRSMELRQERVRRPNDFLRLVKDRNEKFEMHIVRNGVPVLVKFPL